MALDPMAKDKKTGDSFESPRAVKLMMEQFSQRAPSRQMTYWPEPEFDCSRGRPLPRQAQIAVAVDLLTLLIT